MKIVTLRKKGDFRQVSLSPHKWVSQSFILQKATSPGPDLWRFGFIITRKRGNAVLRNRMRRRLKAALREILRELPSPATPVDLVLVARDGLDRCSFLTLVQMLTLGLKRLCVRDNLSKEAPDRL